jgi:hypothetical protein
MCAVTTFTAAMRPAHRPHPLQVASHKRRAAAEPATLGGIDLLCRRGGTRPSSLGCHANVQVAGTVHHARDGLNLLVGEFRPLKKIESRWRAPTVAACIAHVMRLVPDEASPGDCKVVNCSEISNACRQTRASQRIAVVSKILNRIRFSGP